MCARACALPHLGRRPCGLRHLRLGRRSAVGRHEREPNRVGGLAAGGGGRGEQEGDFSSGGPEAHGPRLRRRELGDVREAGAQDGWGGAGGESRERYLRDEREMGMEFSVSQGKGLRQA